MNSKKTVDNRTILVYNIREVKRSPVWGRKGFDGELETG